MNAAALNIGIAGLGRLGARHARMLATRVPRAKLTAACSPVADERAWVARELGVRDVYASYDDLLAHPKLDAVVLVTPTTEHAHQIVEALKAGKHVFSEKPTSLNLADCMAVEEAAA